MRAVSLIFLCVFMATLNACGQGPTSPQRASTASENFRAEVPVAALNAATTTSGSLATEGVVNFIRLPRCENPQPVDCPPAAVMKCGWGSCGNALIPLSPPYPCCKCWCDFSSRR